MSDEIEHFYNESDPQWIKDIDRIADEIKCCAMNIPHIGDRDCNRNITRLFDHVRKQHAAHEAELAKAHAECGAAAKRAENAVGMLRRYMYGDVHSAEVDRFLATFPGAEGKPI